MHRFSRKPFLFILVLLLAAVALFAAGFLYFQAAALSRGIPQTLPEPIPHGGTGLGINIYLQEASDDQIVEAFSGIAKLGVSTVKNSFYYDENFDWEKSDRLLTAAADHGLTLVPLLDGSPTDQFAPPVDPADYAAWAGEFARHYGEQLDYYFIWDEPNLASHWGGQEVNANDYAALLAAAAAAIRSADSQAIIITAPLAPTIETGPQNLADHLFLKELYEAGAADAFDIVAIKPYGFNTGPDDRRVENDILNFSRAILIREEMERNGDGGKALWAGNWGWNSLPANWEGEPSIWGQVSEEQQASWTIAALDRARIEWPWMGIMFLENWQPDAPIDDPRWGFSIANRPAAGSITEYIKSIDPGIAYPGFHLASPDDPAQEYRGGWRFSPEFGADISEPEEGAPPDRLTFTFWGTDAGLAVRRANFRARLYITIDGEPANALPQDENGAALILTSPDPSEDYLTIEPVARNLTPGVHTMEILTSRGWDQWALKGFSVGYQPISPSFNWLIIGLLILGIILILLAIYLAARVDWGPSGQWVRGKYDSLGTRGQLILTGLTAALTALTGWLTWGQQFEDIYRRLGDGGQLALTAAAASVFYLTPTFYIYILALAFLFILVYLRPAWGLALIVFTFPLYVSQLGKEIFVYRFSPVEIFTLLTVGVVLLRWFFAFIKRGQTNSNEKNARRTKLQKADYAVLIFLVVATISLFFTERLGVATNEWRTVILEPALFYFAFRAIAPKEDELWLILDVFVLSGLVVSVIGLWQYATGQNLITAEGGIMRLRSVYGSPNNVALYLERILPLLVSMVLLGAAANHRRRILYGLSIIPLSLAILLTFSKGGLLLGVPAGLLVVFWIWLRRSGRSPWPWAIAFLILGGAALAISQYIPQLADRFDLLGVTGVFRVNLWLSSLEMIRESPFWGVGLDNFLYAYRGRYILDAAWQEPNLNHPHNIFLDFATRLGILGLLAGGWMIWNLFQALRRNFKSAAAQWLPVVVGFSGALAAMLLHGLVDHSFFLVDLAFAFYLMLGVAVWLDNLALAPKITGQS